MLAVLLRPNIATCHKRMVEVITMHTRALCNRCAKCIECLYATAATIGYISNYDIVDNTDINCRCIDVAAS